MYKTTPLFRNNFKLFGVFTAISVFLIYLTYCFVNQYLKNFFLGDDNIILIYIPLKTVFFGIKWYKTV